MQPFLHQVKEKDIKSPAVIIIGEVIRLNYAECFSLSKPGDHFADYINYKDDISLVKS